MLSFIKKAVLSLVLISVVSIYSEVIEKDGYKIINDKLEGSNITILVPEKLSGNLLMLVHGMRAPENALSSEFSTDGEFAQKLAKDGWIIGSTSFRRNGVILHDAIEDVEILKKHIEDKYGKSKNVYLKGGSMGGMIIAMMAEKKDNQYKGAVAIGAALTMQEDENKYELTYEPQIPILFLTNQSELKRPQDYISNYKGKAIEPVLWKVNRNGHCNTNDKEELLAFEALLKFVKTGKIENNKEILIELEEKPSTAVFKDGKAYGKVLSVSESYGNMTVDLRKSDFEKIGINHGEYFQVGFKNKFFDILFGTTYGDVEYGLWIAFFSADGEMQVARNYRNAVKLLKCKEGDSIYIQKIEKPKKEDQFKENPEAMKLVGMYGQELMKKDFKKALEYINEAMEISYDKYWMLVGVVNCYLLSGEFEAAKKIYLENKDVRFKDGSMYFEDSVVQDIEDLKQLKFVEPNFDKMLKLINK